MGMGFSVVGLVEVWIVECEEVEFGGWDCSRLRVGGRCLVLGVYLLYT